MTSTNISFWIDEYKGMLRFMILILFVVSMTGPWMIEQLHVPAEYACSPPTIRLEGDFCGSPLSGIRFLIWFTGGFFYILFELIRGVFPGHPRELLSGLSLLLILPVITTFLLLVEKNRVACQP